MVSGRSYRLLMALVALLIPSALWAQTAAPRIVTISGTPLKINVAADLSFQVYNSSVPGNGQVYPTASSYGDAGFFANVGGTLYAPNFTAHGVTATANLGTYRPWSPVAISTVQGNGSSSSPLTVTVTVAAGTTGITLATTYTYVNGENFFRMQNAFSGNGSMKVFFGFDDFLGGSDNSIAFVEPTLNAPGSEDCGSPPTYHMLIIPVTAASHLTTVFYADVWSQIGAGQLNDRIAPGCIDNAFGLEWDNITAPAQIATAVSFGGIPPASAFQPFSISVDPSFVSLYPGQSTVFTVTAVHNGEVGFNSPIQLSVPNAPSGMAATFDNANFPAPGDGTAKMTVQLAPDIFPLTYNISVLGVAGDSAGTTEGASAGIQVICDPPLILALNNPASQSVLQGSTATLTVKSEGVGPFTYQWYAGHAGFASSPIANATSATFTTPPVTSYSEYWVRVSDACGTADSQTAAITPHN